MYHLETPRPSVSSATLSASLSLLGPGEGFSHLFLFSDDKVNLSVPPLFRVMRVRHLESMVMKSPMVLASSSLDARMSAIITRVAPGRRLTKLF